MDSAALGFAKQAGAEFTIRADEKSRRKYMGRGAAIGAAALTGVGLALNRRDPLSAVGGVIPGALGGAFVGAGMADRKAGRDYVKRHGITKKAGVLGAAAKKIVTPKNLGRAALVGGGAAGGVAVAKKTQKQAPMGPGALARSKRRMEIDRYGSF